MIEELDDRTIYAASLIAVLGVLVSFQAGVIFSGLLTDGSATSAQVTASQVKDKVSNYVKVATGDRANATVTSVKESTKLDGFYEVKVEVAAQVGNQTRTSTTTLFVSDGGTYFFGGEPKNLNNPQPPRQRTVRPQ